MANYRDIKGFQIQSVDSDPVPYSGSWSSGGSLNTAKSRMGAFGIQTAGVVAGGEPTPSVIAQTEEYDGTSWTEVNELNTGRIASVGFGTLTAGAVAGGGPPAVANTEKYDYLKSYNNLSGINEYRLYSYLSTLFNNITILDIGTGYGTSAIALSHNETNQVISYNIVDQIGNDSKLKTKKSIIFKII